MRGAEHVNGHHPGERRAAAPAEPRNLTPDALANGLYAKRGELKALARRHGLTLDELARRAAEPDAARSIGSLRRLAEARAGVLLARARADATSLLLSLASSAESDETRRRACVDLLKAPSLAHDAAAPESDDRVHQDDGASTSLLALLERLGEATRERVSADAEHPEPDGDGAR